MRILKAINNLFKGSSMPEELRNLYLEGLDVSKKIAEIGECRTCRLELEA